MVGRCLKRLIGSPHNKQAVELRAAVVIQAYNLTVKDSFMRNLRQRRTEAREGFVNVSLPGDQAAGTRFDDREGAKAVELQLVQPIKVVERVAPDCQAHGSELRKHRYFDSTASCPGALELAT